MANLIRSAKSGNDWTFADLQAYNIRILTIDTEEFFGVPHLPAPTVDPIILNNIEAPVSSHLSPDICTFFHLLRKVTPPMPKYDCDPAAHEEPPYIVNFSFHILHDLLRFSLPDRWVTRHYALRFIVGGKLVEAKLDIALLDSKKCILLILEDNVSLPPLTIATHHL
jgi:hypothetical protein